jgi:hypothetical protein
MTGALARIEARHLARSPLLWLGVAMAALSTATQIGESWPVLAGDDLFAYQNGFLVGAGAVWAGAWLGLRDRASGADDLVAVTPTAPWRLWRARLVALAAVTAGASALLFGAVLAVSAFRGGHGVPDLRLLADGALGVVLSGLVGVAVGRLSGSRLAGVLAGAAWFVLAMLAADPGVSPAHRLAPALLQSEEKSAVLGLLPDPFWPHLAYLLGLVLLAAVFLLALAGRGGGGRPARAPVAAAVVVGLVLVGSGAARLVALPERLVPLGPERADWKPGPEADAVLAGPYLYPDDGLATSCAGDPVLSVCVYPVYGTGLAGHWRETLAPVTGLLAGLPGVPTRVRMVPLTMFLLCGDGEVQLGEQLMRWTRSQPSQMVAVPYLDCALGVHRPQAPEGSASPSTDVVKLWALVASGMMSRQELQGGGGQDLWQSGALSEPPSALVGPALAMADLPPDRARVELAPVWERLRAGTLPVSELPGQRP